MLMRRSSFNSSQVRLKDIVVRTMFGYTHFQFLTGTIKRIATSQTINCLPNFQFLIGTIKSLPFCHSLAAFCKTFNSSQVRLKGVKWLIVTLFVAIFQFLIGTIKRMTITRYMYQETTFNSSQVRLKESYLFKHSNNIFFQFLIGTIKSKPAAMYPMNTDLSIPHRYD